MELNLTIGVFKQELKNRFLCLVEIDGEDTLCYISSSCKLSNFMDLNGKKVLLLPVMSPKSRTKYSVYALAIRNSYILLNLAKTNEVIGKNICGKHFSFLGTRKRVKKEFKIDNYKSDLFIEDTKTVIEIKSILSFDKTKKAVFPSIYSQRAIEQLVKISSLLDKGYNVCYIFVSLNPQIESLVINEFFAEYVDIFEQCINKGMKVKGVSVKLISGRPVIYSSLPVTI